MQAGPLNSIAKLEEFQASGLCRRNNVGRRFDANPSEQ
jgi:hypothetical protein